MDSRELSTHITRRSLEPGKCFYLYVLGLSTGGGHGDGSLCTDLDCQLVEDRDMLLYVRTWTPSWLRTWRWFYLYVPGLSAGGGQGYASLCAYLGCLLKEDREMVFSVRQGTASLCSSLVTLLVEDREMLLSVPTWVIC